MKKIIFYLISVFDKIIKKNNKKILYTSFPDFSDNSFALFVYMSNNHPEYQSIWLVDKIKKSNVYRKMTLNYTRNDKYIVVKKSSLCGIYHYLTSKYVFFTHGLYTGVNIPNNHIVTNLWHGMPLKSIAYLDSQFKGVVQKSRYIISTSLVYQDIMAKAFGVNKKRVLVTGQPRNDLLGMGIVDFLNMFNIKDRYKYLFMWMPTYRKSVIGDLRVDGNETGSLPILSIKELEELNLELKKIKSFMFIKLHPMDILVQKKIKEHSNISIIRNNDLEEKGVQLYSLLGHIDVLLTDYSSIYIDFLLTDKPVAFVMEDMDEFSSSRGFVFEKPLNYMPGKIITNKKSFFNFLKNPVKDDKYENVFNDTNVVKKSYSHEVFKQVNLN